MAKKRLNKKVVLIGSGIFVFLALAVITLILRWGQDPEKFIKDGDVAVQAARQAVDEQIRKQQYERALRSYRNARKLVKTDLDRIDILSKLADVYLEMDRWNKVLESWGQIIQIDPKNIKARFARLRYVYIFADSGARGAWKEVASQASELIELADGELLTENIAEWESFGMRQKPCAKQMGPYLYLLKGRATLEMARMGVGVDPDKSIDSAIDDLEKVRKLEPDNVDAYWYLAQAIMAKGESLALKGNLRERDKAREQAEEVLQQAVEHAGADPGAHINLLAMKTAILVQTSGATLSEEQIQVLESEYLALVEKFDSSERAYSALAGFYQRLGPKKLDKTIEAVEKAVELDRESVAYAASLANLYYLRFSVYGQKPQLIKAIELARNTLTLPDAQDKGGPRRWASINNRVWLYSLLANCYIEQILQPCEEYWSFVKRQASCDTRDEIRDTILTNAEKMVHEIEQLLGSGQDPQVVKWRGMLELAKGNRNLAIRQLYATYEQLKASGQRDAQLAYTLAKLFGDTSELGVAAEFFASALSIPDRRLPDRIDESKPGAFLDYANVLLKLGSYESALNVANFFEEEYWANRRTGTLRINALLGANQLDDAEKELADTSSWPTDDPNTIKLKLALGGARIAQLQRNITQKQVDKTLNVIAPGLLGPEEQDVEQPRLPETRLQGSVQVMTSELKNYQDIFAESLQKLLVVEPNSVPTASVTAVCNNYIEQGKIQRAKDLVNQSLEYFPDNTTLLFYKQILGEPEPGKISPERRKEIEENVLSDIAEPIRRSVNLGVFYRRNNEPNKAAEEFKKALKMETSQEGVINVPAFDGAKEINDLQRLALGYLFDMALASKDWKLAEQIAQIGRRENLDECDGKFFAARLTAAKEQYKDALAKINECLKQRPVFSYGFLLRSNLNAALGNDHTSIEDAQKAASLNPMDGDIARVLASALYRRNAKLGNNVTVGQVIEVKDALVRAIRLNPGQWQLQSFYAEYISEEDPTRALVIRQHLQEVAPSAKNALLLGNMALRTALRQTNAERKKALLDIAASSFEQALTYEPQNKEVLNSYAEYYRLTGQPRKAEQLLAQSQDEMSLAGHYFRSGQFEHASQIMEQLYRANPKNIDALKGLVLTAERTADQNAAKKYSEELLLLEDSIDNHLMQLQVFLKIGLIKEAEYKLQSLKEKFPDEARTLLLEAWLRMRQGQLKRALELTNKALSTGDWPSAIEALAWQLRGETNLLMANYEQAIIDLEKCKALSPESGARTPLAKAYLRAGRQGDAIIELKSILGREETPGLQAQLFLRAAQNEKAQARLLLEQVYLQLGRKEALKGFYDETLEKFPDNVFWLCRAGAFAILQSDFNRAEQLYRQAWQKSRKGGTGDAVAFDGYLRALLLGAGTPNEKDTWNPGKLDKLFEEARQYVDGDFAPIALFRMAEAKLRLQDKASTIQYCREALKKAEANDSLTSNILQKMYVLLGAEEVRRVCKERLEANPDSLVANYTMFNLANISGEYDEAVRYIDRCIQIAGPGSPRGVDYMVRKAMALQLAYDKTSYNNYLKMAITEYESLLTKTPNNTTILNNLAYTLAENNEKLEEALRCAKRAHEARPNNPDFMDTYSYVLYKNGRYSEADEFLQAALQQYEQNRISASAEVYEHLGMIKEKLGARTQALAAYQQALKTGVDKLSDKVRKRIEDAIKRLD